MAFCPIAAGWTRTLGRGLGVIFGVCVAPVPVGAEVPRTNEAEVSDAEAAAGLEFERGVEHFAAQQYEAAAKSFLKADHFVANLDALSNALTSARKAGDPLLVVEIARRILGRGDAPYDLVTGARGSLAEAKRSLAEVRARCTPAPCRLFFNGQPIADGVPATLHDHFVRPGRYILHAEFERAGRSRELQKEFLAGSAQDFTFEPEARRDASVVRVPERRETPAPPVVEGEQGKSWEKALFYGGVVATVGLAGTTIWSGVDAISYHNSIDGVPTEEERQGHDGRALRTDILLGASLGMGVLTLGWALFGVEWDEQASPVAIGWGPSGGFIRAQGRLP